MSDERPIILYSGEQYSKIFEHLVGLPDLGFAESLLDFLNSVEGPFAFIVSRGSQVFFGRDPMGRRSLDMSKTTEGLVIGSNLKAIPHVECGTSGVYQFDWETLSLEVLPWKRPAAFWRPEFWLAPKHASHPVETVMLLLTEAVRKRVQSCPENVGILFSGGLDSTLLAHLAAPFSDSIELITASTLGDSLSPDLCTALVSFEELKNLHPNKFTLRICEISPQDVADNHSDITKLAAKGGRRDSVNQMDYSIVCALFFASRSRGRQLRSSPVDPTFVSQVFENEGVAHEKPRALKDSGCPAVTNQGQPPQKVYAQLDLGATDSSSAHLLLMGTGADELFGGYFRYASQARMGGDEGMLAAMKVDLQRLHSRNMSRDDCILGHFGKEGRFPYLDEALVEYIGTLPAATLLSNEGVYIPGGKSLLRSVARLSGLQRCPAFKKRAIQFGTRMAKLSASLQGVTLRHITKKKPPMNVKPDCGSH